MGMIDISRTVWRSKQYFERRENPQIMDNENFPDLHEFYEILEVIICSAKTERPNSLFHSRKAKLSSQYICKYFDLFCILITIVLWTQITKRGNTSLLWYTLLPIYEEMDYHGPSMARMMCHKMESESESFAADGNFEISDSPLIGLLGNRILRLKLLLLF